MALLASYGECEREAVHASAFLIRHWSVPLDQLLWGMIYPVSFVLGRPLLDHLASKMRPIVQLDAGRWAYPPAKQPQAFQCSSLVGMCSWGHSNVAGICIYHHQYVL